MITPKRLIRVKYTNYRGEVDVRQIIPVGPLKFRATDYHPEPQWIMRAFDIEKQAYREFALRDCDFSTL